MRKIAGLLSVVAAAAAAAPAGAAPSGKGLVTETFNCGPPLGEVAITHGSGNSGWAVELDTHFVLASFSQGSLSQTYGNKRGMSGLVECTSEDGLVTLTSYPVPPGS